MDLLERLRNHKGTAHVNETEAADEIERLTLENVKYKRLLDNREEAARWLYRNQWGRHPIMVLGRWPWLLEE